MKRTLFFILFLIWIAAFAQNTIFSPYEGLMPNPGNVTIAQPNSTIYYTMDGSEPTVNSPSAVNSVDIYISARTTFKAFTVSNGTTSPVETMTYYVGSFVAPKLFFKPPANWAASCAYMNIIEPRTLVDFFEPGPTMNDACEGWKKITAVFGKGYTTFNNCLMYPPNVQYTPTFIVDADFFYDFSAGIITDPPACLLSANETGRRTVAVKVYPNPVPEILRFETDLSFTSYQILDSSGKVLEQKKLSQNQINVSGLSKGIYFLKLISENQKTEHFARFIKN